MIKFNIYINSYEFTIDACIIKNLSSKLLSGNDFSDINDTDIL